MKGFEIMTESKGSFSLVLPCYNEALSLPDLVGRAIACAKKRNLSPDQFQLIPVENGSTDSSRQVLQELAKGPDAQFITPVWIDENQGYGHGILTGLKAAKTDVVGWTHADEQCDPEDAFKAWEVINQSDSLTFVKGKRHGRTPMERFVSAGFATFASILYLRKFSEINAQPKVFPRALLDEFIDPPKDFSLDFYALLQANKSGYKVVEIDVKFPPRPHGQSNWASTFKSRMRTISGFVGYMLRLRVGG